MNENTYEAGQKVLITLGDQFDKLVGNYYPAKQFEGVYVQEDRLKSIPSPFVHEVEFTLANGKKSEEFFFADEEVSAT